MQFEKEWILAIGPSGSGKSTYLRSLNRMNDTIDIARVTEIWYEGSMLIVRISMFMKCASTLMIFQRPNPFAKSIYKNTTFHERAGVKRQEDFGRIGPKLLWNRQLYGIRSGWRLNGQPWHFQVASSNDIARAISVKPDYLTHGWACFSADPSRQRRWKKPCLSWRKIMRLSRPTACNKQPVLVIIPGFLRQSLVSTIRLQIFFQNAKLQSTNDYVSWSLDEVKWQQKRKIEWQNQYLKVKDLSVYYNKEGSK